ncbi:hypothetical protein CDAR_423461 [Caerostris darwini]|uniref:Uncharacterized protein n=1 Tax=Caerostris darwini TaxID=1538125 RepID=A0AAV4TJF7_9ARAC|nr:hypothetical protein CDAR_423461 [Caerostris darwini]
MLMRISIDHNKPILSSKKSFVLIHPRTISLGIAMLRMPTFIDLFADLTTDSNEANRPPQTHNKFCCNISSSPFKPLRKKHETRRKIGHTRTPPLPKKRIPTPPSSHIP